MLPVDSVDIIAAGTRLLTRFVATAGRCTSTLEVALAVQQELQARLGEVDRLRKQQVERVHYEAELAKRLPARQSRQSVSSRFSGS